VASPPFFLVGGVGRGSVSLEGVLLPLLFPFCNNIFLFNTKMTKKSKKAPKRRRDKKVTNYNYLYVWRLTKYRVLAG